MTASIEPTKSRILFVDDELAILAGLRNVLRKQRHRWEMSFAPGGPAALEILGEQPIDVVVTDMRMPGMDGGELLREVRTRWPAVTRIILSGHADRDAMVRTIPIAHQFLAKPCSPEHLSTVIERTCELRGRLADPGLQRLVNWIDGLPVVPRIDEELRAALAERTGGVRLAGLIAANASLSVRVLQLVNSAYFGPGRQVTSIADAVAYLGPDVVHSVVMSAHVAGRCPAAGDLAELSREAIATARLARQLVLDPALADEAFAAGLLADIGRVVLAIGEIADDRVSPLHAEVGACLLGLWGLPFSITEVVAGHHDVASVSPARHDLAAAVHLAVALLTGADLDRSAIESARVERDPARWSALVAEVAS